MSADLDPRQELAALAVALRAHVARLRRAGRRVRIPRERVGSPGGPGSPAPVPPGAVPPGADPAVPPPGIRPPSRAAAGPDASGSPPRAPRERAEAAFDGQTPLKKDAVAERAAEIGRIAAGCSDLADLEAAVAGCTACDLCGSRTRTVFSDGSGRAGVVFVGEAPGYHEDQRGVPFVGRAGQLLTDIVTKGMGLAREDVYIANVLKCRPPENRDPTGAEKALCTPWLDRQLELIEARVIVALGRHAAGHLLASDASMARLRGRVHDRGGRRVVATYHPAYLLRSPQMKKECWKDIRVAMGELGLAVPGAPSAADSAEGAAPGGAGDGNRPESDG